MRDKVWILGYALAFILEVLCADTGRVSPRTFTHMPHFSSTHNTVDVLECRRRTPITWECADFIIAEDLR